MLALPVGMISVDGPRYVKRLKPRFSCIFLIQLDFPFQTHSMFILLHSSTQFALHCIKTVVLRFTIQCSHLRLSESHVYFHASLFYASMHCVGVFYQQIFCSWRIPLGAKINHSRDMRFMLVRARGKQIKALRPVATLVFLYSARCNYNMANSLMWD